MDFLQTIQNLIERIKNKVELIFMEYEIKQINISEQNELNTFLQEFIKIQKKPFFISNDPSESKKKLSQFVTHLTDIIINNKFVKIDSENFATNSGTKTRLAKACYRCWNLSKPNSTFKEEELLFKFLQQLDCFKDSSKKQIINLCQQSSNRYG